jgi:pimeloyl-ACP methyl ester carboxylesterase
MELHLHRWESQGPEISKIVLLHGMGGTGALWRPIAAGLEDRFTVIAPDQRGHGRSRVPRSGSASASDYTPLRYGEDVVESLAPAGVSRALFVGHSMGVRTACAVAHLRSELVSGLVLVDLGLEGPAGGGLGDTLSKFLGELPTAPTPRSPST